MMGFALTTSRLIRSAHQSAHEMKSRLRETPLRRAACSLAQVTWGFPQNAFGLAVFLAHAGRPHFHFHDAIVTTWESRKALSLGMFIFLPGAGVGASSGKPASASGTNAMHTSAANVDSVDSAAAMVSIGSADDADIVDGVDGAAAKDSVDNVACADSADSTASMGSTDSVNSTAYMDNADCATSVDSPASIDSAANVNNETTLDSTDGVNGATAMSSADGATNIDSTTSTNNVACADSVEQPLLVHEYGHTIQSLMLGPLYLIVVGLPSVVWMNLPSLARWRARTGMSYYAFFSERWANRLGERVLGEPAIW